MLILSIIIGMLDPRSSVFTVSPFVIGMDFDMLVDFPSIDTLMLIVAFFESSVYLGVSSNLGKSMVTVSMLVGSSSGTSFNSKSSAKLGCCTPDNAAPDRVAEPLARMKDRRFIEQYMLLWC